MPSLCRTKHDRAINNLHYDLSGYTGSLYRAMKRRLNGIGPQKSTGFLHCGELLEDVCVGP